MQKPGGMPIVQMLFGLSGRIRRRDFWLWSVVNFVAYLIASIFMMSFVVSTALDGSGSGVKDWQWNLFGICTLPFLWIAAALNIKRLHDVGRSYRWWRINLIPVVGWGWTLFVCGFRDGTPGPNRYGPSPKGVNDPEKVFE